MQVVDAYERACAVSREHSLPVLEACHIKPYTRGANHELPNGLLLRSDIHKLFDRGYVTVDPDYNFRVSERLRAHWNNGRVYYDFADQPIRTPAPDESKPNPELLEWHRDEVFLG